jgi:hypothetical protein
VDRIPAIARTFFGSAAAVALLGAVSTAQAQRVVPPGNSAANQYTETFPTTNGDEATADKGGEGDRTPAKVLGPEDSRRLEGLGPEGRAAAALAAETAPVGGGQRGEPGANDAGGGRSDAGESAAAGSGSDGLGQVIGQATGTSSSGGPLVILVIAIAIAFSAAYLLRRKRRTA